MPDLPPSGAAEGTPLGRAAALTPERIEAVLADFRSWLSALPAAASQPLSEPAATVDLHTLVAQFTALRHEVNLQTKAVRGQQEQSAETVRLLADTVAALERRSDPTEDDDRLRPVLKGLIETYDALATAKRELERVRESAVPPWGLFPRTDDPVPEAPLRPVTFWERLRGRSPSADPTMIAWRERLFAMQQERRQAGQVLERGRGFVESVITGYTMSLQRLDRLLEQQGLEPMASVGRPFDPERMEVLEAVAGSGRSSGEVLEEVRRGYLWRGRVFRFALVRVAKN